jgi:NCAIR mutase (PurE)-related protein
MTAQNDDVKKALEQFAEDFGIKVYTQDEVEQIIKEKLEEQAKMLKEQFAEEKDEAIREAVEKVKSEIFAQMEKEKKIEQICQKFGIDKEVFANCKTVEDVLDVFAKLDIQNKTTEIVGASFAEKPKKINPWDLYKPKD